MLVKTDTNKNLRQRELSTRSCTFRRGNSVIVTGDTGDTINCFGGTCRDGEFSTACSTVRCVTSAGDSRSSCYNSIITSGTHETEKLQCDADGTSTTGGSCQNLQILEGGGTSWIICGGQNSCDRSSSSAMRGKILWECRGQSSCSSMTLTGGAIFAQCNGAGSCSKLRISSTAKLDCNGQNSCQGLTATGRATIHCKHESSCPPASSLSKTESVTVNCHANVAQAHANAGSSWCESATTETALEPLAGENSSNSNTVSQESWIIGFVVIGVVLFVAVATLLYLGNRNQWSWWKKHCQCGRRQKEDSAQAEGVNDEQTANDAQKEEIKEQAPTTRPNEEAQEEHPKIYQA